jgi:hypothetical protein
MLEAGGVPGLTVRQVLRRPAKYLWHWRISGRLPYNTTMKRPTHSTTLRLSLDLAEAIQNRAYEQCIAQSDWIRRALRRALVEEQEREKRQAKELSATKGIR